MPTPVRSTNATIVTPPELGLAQLRITAFSALSPTQQLQAAALALHRELSVESINLRLAAQPAALSRDVAQVAFSTIPIDTEPSIACTLLPAMQPDIAYWVNAPAGYIVSERGAATVDFVGVHDELPSVVVATLSTLDSGDAARCVLVNRDRALISDERVSWWAAASGVAMLDGGLPSAVAVPLLAPLRPRLSVRKTALDRALLACSVAAIACVALAAFQYLSVPSPVASPPVATRASHATAGALLDRIGSIAPETITQTQGATYASGAWVIALPDGFDAAALIRVQRALEANGMLVQSTGAPSPRIRVQLP